MDPSTGPVVVRAARREDGPALQHIELAAGARFRTVGLGAIADHDPFSLDELRAYETAGRSWVAVEPTGQVVGYVVVDVVDGLGHVEQVSVLPDHQGAGVGRRLLDRVIEWAVAEGRPAVTLTTFTHVAWNRPLYEHLGYRVLDDDELGPELRALRAEEARHGLELHLRVCMRLDLPPTA